MTLILFHRTSSEAAEKIIQEGLKDGTGNYMMIGLDEPLVGTFFSDLPVNCQDGTKEGEDGGVLFEVTLDLTEAEIARYEIIEDFGPDPLFGYREWCIPAALVNKHGTLRAISKDEEMDWDDPRYWFRGQPASHPSYVGWRRNRGYPSGGIYTELFDVKDLSSGLQRMQVKYMTKSQETRGPLMQNMEIVRERK